MSYDYRPLVAGRDDFVVDSATGAIQGVRTSAGVQMLNGVTTYASSMGGGRTALASGEFITIPANSQSIVAGGVTVASGASITCVGEFVAIKY